jgi:hypothetical protein
MAKEAHTPGPWELDERHRSAYIPYRGKHHLAAAYGGTVANARLIAAAPDGYDANVAALGLLEEIAEADGLTPELDEVITGLRAAIAKARGKAA